SSFPAGLSASIAGPLLSPIHDARTACEAASASALVTSAMTPTRRWPGLERSTVGTMRATNSKYVLIPSARHGDRRDHPGGDIVLVHYEVQRADADGRRWGREDHCLDSLDVLQNVHDVLGPDHVLQTGGGAPPSDGGARNEVFDRISRWLGDGGAGHIRVVVDGDIDPKGLLCWMHRSRARIGCRRPAGVRL